MGEAVPTVKIGVLGAGTVGAQVIRLLKEKSEDFLARSGGRLTISAILVRNTEAPRDAPIPSELLTTNPATAIDGNDLVIELIGGIEPARTFVLQALNQGITVITGNKTLLATHGPELFAAAEKTGAGLYYEAAVAGAIPVVYGLRESLAGDRITRVMGIVNGTTNFILDAMTTTSADYADTLVTAQQRGFAEADPAADVEGYDAAAKCALLASLAFHTRVGIDDVYTEGITKITARDISEATKNGQVIKLLAIAERATDAAGNHGVSVRVHPTLLPASHPLASVSGAFNAVLVEGEAAGPLMFYGQGAGGAPTASAVLSDVVAAAWHCVHGGHAPRESVYADLPILPHGDTQTCYQVRVRIADAVGVLAQVAGIFAESNVSIRAVSQRREENTSDPTVSICTHVARENQLAEVVKSLELSPVVQGIESIIRMER